ncbi:WapI family immunity protein [Streptomyces vinaceus]
MHRLILLGRQDHFVGRLRCNGIHTSTVPGPSAKRRCPYAAGQSDLERPSPVPLGSADRVELRPLRYQLPRAGANSYDDDRLVIGGTVTTAEGRWSFAGPCLLVDEAREVAVPGHVVHRARPGLRPRRPERGWGGGSGPPVLGSGAPWQQGDDRADVYQHSVEVAVTTAALLRAADRWDAGLASLPAR